MSTETIELEIHVENGYSGGENFRHDLTITAAAPSTSDVSSDEFFDWLVDELMPHTGEGPEYADRHGSYSARITAAPAGYEYLTGQWFTADG